MARPDPALLNPARYPFRHVITTRFSDMDPNQHLNNVALAAMMEDGRVRFNVGMGMRVALGQRRAMVASMGIEYLSEGHFPGPVEVFCAIEAVGRTSWTIVQVLMQEDRTVAFARSIIVSIADGRPAPVPDDFRAELTGNWGLRP